MTVRLTVSVVPCLSECPISCHKLCVTNNLLNLYALFFVPLSLSYPLLGPLCPDGPAFSVLGVGTGEGSEGRG